MDAYEQFCAVLSEFGRSLGEDLKFDPEDMTCTFLIDDEVPVNLVYLPASEQVVAWTSLGGLPEDGYAAARARRLLEMNNLWRATHGFTVSLSDDDRRALVHDRRAVTTLWSADLLATWVDDLVSLVSETQTAFLREFPFWEDPAETGGPRIVDHD